VGDGKCGIVCMFVRVQVAFLAESLLSDDDAEVLSLCVRARCGM
jgi:hypothetical protein